MVDLRGDVLRPPHGTTPAAVKSNIKSEMRSFKSNENIHKKEGGSYYVVSPNKEVCLRSQTVLKANFVKSRFLCTWRLSVQMWLFMNMLSSKRNYVSIKLLGGQLNDNYYIVNSVV